MINAPPTDDRVIVEAQVRDYGFSPGQQDEIWRRRREGQSFRLIERALGAPMQHARRFLCQSGGVRLTPRTRSQRHPSISERGDVPRHRRRGISPASGQAAGGAGVKKLVGVLSGPAEQVLHAVRSGITGPLGNRPTVLAEQGVSAAASTTASTVTGYGGPAVLISADTLDGQGDLGDDLHETKVSRLVQVADNVLSRRRVPASGSAVPAGGRPGSMRAKAAR